MNHWIAVASAEHVRRGRAGGFMQVCHGKAAPLRRIKPDDRVIYYSPSEVYGSKDHFQTFTAIGMATDEEPYSFDMGGGFVPYRRNVLWLPATEAPIHPLLDELDFSMGKRNWGYQFRFGILAISQHDANVIAEAMEAVLPYPHQDMPP